MIIIKRKNEQEVIDKYKEFGLILCEKYKHTKYYHKCIDLEGYAVLAPYCDLKGNYKPHRFCPSNPHTLDNIQLYLKINNSGFTLKADQTYINATTQLVFICPIHKDFENTWDNTMQHNNCPYCTKKRLSDTNRLSTNRPDLIKYFENSEDADTVSLTTKKIVKLRCPECKHPKELSVGDLSSIGFSCPQCGDRISTPNKFMYRVLKYLNVEFKSEKIFNWSQKRKYDFYIHSMDMIIECHGLQHYEFTGGRFTEDAFKIIQENDMLKEKLARENGILHYVIVDCRKSELDWLSKNTKFSLKDFFNMNIDYTSIYENCLRSNIIRACNLWENSNIFNINEISKEMNVHPSTIIRYLKRGAKIGICSYDSKKSKTKNNARANCVPVFNCAESMPYSSIREASTKEKTYYGKIKGFCEDEQNTDWKYISIEEYKTLKGEEYEAIS